MYNKANNITAEIIENPINRKNNFFRRNINISPTIGRPKTAAKGQPVNALKAVQKIDKNLNLINIAVKYKITISLLNKKP